MLSNTDLGLGPSACLDGDLGLQGDEAVLEVALDTRAVNLIEAGNAPDLPGWPAAFSNEVTGGPCGSGYYVRFQVGRYPYVAWAGFGPDASQEVREALFEIASTMEIDEQAFVRATRERTPAYVIAGGENAAGPWRLEARPSPLGALSSNVALTLFGAEGGSVVEGFGVPGVPIEQAGGDPTFGAVTKQAASVELRSDGVVASREDRAGPAEPRIRLRSLLRTHTKAMSSQTRWHWTPTGRRLGGSLRRTSDPRDRRREPRHRSTRGFRLHVGAVGTA